MMLDARHGKSISVDVQEYGGRNARDPQRRRQYYFASSASRSAETWEYGTAPESTFVPIRVPGVPLMPKAAPSERSASIAAWYCAFFEFIRDSIFATSMPGMVLVSVSIDGRSPNPTSPSSS